MKALLIISILWWSTIFSAIAYATPSLSGGFWMNYQYIQDNDVEEDTLGTVNSEALVLYADSKSEDMKWQFSAELRLGPGSFTNSSNNSTGDSYTLHKAWISHSLTDQSSLVLGKSQVPFGWATGNFWPGDMFQAGYGDQMDVGVKWVSRQTIDVALAFYHADDWGGTSTDTTDDNNHWGSSTTYRKLHTLVGDIKYPVNENHSIGFSYQVGKLQDLSATRDPSDSITGDHQAWVLYYEGKLAAKTTIKGEYISASRDIPDAYAVTSGLTETIENSRIAVEVNHDFDNWSVYVDVMMADPNTSGNAADTITAYAPGARYDYGPGWIYIEWLDQDGYIDADGLISEGDFTALYTTIDYYF